MKFMFPCLLLSLTVAVVGIRLLLWSFSCYKIRRLAKTATLLDGDVNVGDYVHFHGRLAMPKAKTPFGKEVCGYFNVTVRALFESKAPKPDRGMVTHRPILQRIDTDDLPLLISDGKRTVHLAGNENSHLISNINRVLIPRYVPPSEEVAALAQPKYDHYLIEEKWLPMGAELSLWGTVLDVNRHCITIGQGPGKTTPLMAYQGDKSSFVSAFGWQMAKTLTAVLLLLPLPALLWRFPPSEDQVVLYTIAVGAAAIWLFAHHSALRRSPFAVDD